ncbi:MAG: hypothetical protein U0871_15640 [Gemmataceae bacterium]
MPLDTARLSERDREFLALFRSHPALTPAAVRRLACPGDSANAVMKVARRLTYRGWVEVHRLPGGGVFYLLTRRAAAALGLPRRKRRGLGQDAAVEHLGQLWLCLRLGVRKRSAAEFAAACPELCRRGLSASRYAVAPDDRLLWLLVDHGGRGPRLAAKAARAAAVRFDLPAFRELIEGGGFGIVVAVPTDAKAAEVTAALAAESLHPLVAVRILVVPELVPLFLKGV